MAMELKNSHMLEDLCIIAKVDAVCRNFLWDNSADFHKVPLVAWDTVCRPKGEGGLGIHNMEMMNRALIGKLVNWIAEDKDSIWVNWVKQNYLKGRNWWSYKPGANTSWVWRRICKVKQDLVTAYTNGAWHSQGVGFSTASCYHWLMGSRPKVSWDKVIWNEWVIPKHQFMGWIFAHGAFKTKTKLISYGMDIDASCWLCGQVPEDLDHLFFGCVYSGRILQHLQQTTGLVLPVGNCLNWCLQNSGTKMQRGVKAGLILGAIYQVWYQRNKCRNEGVLLLPKQAALNIVADMKLRVHGKDWRKLTRLEIEWLKEVGFM
ncbi:uncharacterized protein LOC141588109 [Silene latifolia]|uniref:uncharacterized protein LOC141588109 n=1 Tax=Silene latifolia TaxID=37657 RepID=UPI003D76B52F